MPDTTKVAFPVDLRVVEPDVDVLPGGLVYDPTDPYAVTLLVFDVVSDKEWRFARDLLIDGLSATVEDPAGDTDAGDVHVWRQWHDVRRMVMVRLIGTEGSCVLALAASSVSALLEASLRMVPRGTESERIDWDAMVAELLAGDAPW